VKITKDTTKTSIIWGGDTCEAVDFNHYIIEGKPYILNVTHGISTPTGALMGQSTVLYREDKK
jgi:hypothetical protein